MLQSGSSLYHPAETSIIKVTVTFTLLITMVSSQPSSPWTQQPQGTQMIPVNTTFPWSQMHCLLLVHTLFICLTSSFLCPQLLNIGGFSESLGPLFLSVYAPFLCDLMTSHDLKNNYIIMITYLEFPPLLQPWGTGTFNCMLNTSISALSMTYPKQSSCEFPLLLPHWPAFSLCSPTC